MPNIVIAAVLCIALLISAGSVHTHYHLPLIWTMIGMAAVIAFGLLAIPALRAHIAKRRDEP